MSWPSHVNVIVLVPLVQVTGGGVTSVSDGRDDGDDEVGSSKVRSPSGEGDGVACGGRTPLGELVRRADGDEVGSFVG